MNILIFVYIHQKIASENHLTLQTIDQSFKQIQKGCDKKLIGFKLKEKSIPRKGYEIFDVDNRLIGMVTSGTFSPILKEGIGLAHVNYINRKDDLIYIKIRKNIYQAEIIKTPFI